VPEKAVSDSVVVRMCEPAVPEEPASDSAVMRNEMWTSVPTRRLPKIATAAAAATAAVIVAAVEEAATA
jgi:anti-sigma-K factor RskA